MNTAHRYLSSLNTDQLTTSLSFALDKNLPQLEHVTSFFPSIILSMLPPGILDSIKSDLVSFLLDQASPQWTWNYWSRKSKEFIKIPYPDDLDDTMCSLSAIKIHRQEIIDANVLAKVISNLTSLETQEGGPYRTWVTDRSASKIWQDIDLAVNMNIAFFLSLFDIRLPSLTKLAEEVINNKHYISPYYPSPYPVIYFIGRGYKGKHSKKLNKDILSRRQDGIWENPLYTALMISTLIRLGEKPELLQGAIDYLKSIDTFLPIPFCFDPSREGSRYVAGSSALTAAAILEALTLCNFDTRPLKKPKEAISYSAHQIVNKYMSSLSEPLGSSMDMAVNRIKRIDEQQPISLLPHIFNNSLKLSHRVSTSFCNKLGAATLFGWIAYTLYDDIWDNEDKATENLAAANCSLRQLTTIYERGMFDNPKFLQTMHETMDSMENSFLWETVNCHHPSLKKLPNYGDVTILADRSLGHALSPLAILHSSHSPYKSISHITELFRSYLTARQLLDDMHDLQFDLKNGHFSYIATDLIKKYPKTSLNDLGAALWSHEIGSYLDRVDSLITKAELHWKLSKVGANNSFIALIMSPLRSACNQARSEHSDVLCIINSLAEN